jgi:hypothetical protein
VKHPAPPPKELDYSTYEGPTIGGIREEQTQRNDEFTKQQEEREKGLYEGFTHKEDPHTHEHIPERPRKNLSRE